MILSAEEDVDLMVDENHMQLVSNNELVLDDPAIKPQYILPQN